MKVNTTRKELTKTNVSDKKNKNATRIITLLVILAFVAVITGIVITVGIIINMILNPSIPSTSIPTTQK